MSSLVIKDANITKNLKSKPLYPEQNIDISGESTSLVVKDKLLEDEQKKNIKKGLTSLIVKDETVTVKIDEKEYNLTKNQKLVLYAGAKICVTNGNGIVVVANQVQLSAKLSEPCVTLAKKKEFNYKVLLKKYADKVAQVFEESKEQIKLAVTRKGGEPERAKGVMVIKAFDEFLVIKNSTWSPLPVVLKVLDNKDKIFYLDINKDKDETLFIIPREVLKSEYKVLVSDGFGDLVVDVELEFK